MVQERLERISVIDEERPNGLIKDKEPEYKVFYRENVRDFIRTEDVSGRVHVV